MFGYVKANVPELRVREAEFYRSVYCGLCRTMRKKLGLTSSAALSYDMVFLIMVRLALTGNRYEIRRRRCFKLRSRPMMEPGPELVYASAVSALLTQLKLEDDIRDERGAKKLAARILSPTARRHLRRAGIDRALEDAARRYLSELYALEADGRSGDVPFGELLGCVFAHGLDEVDARIAREIGRGVGRWIYTVDAVDDIADDARAGRWNPVSALWEGLPTETAKAATDDALRLTLTSAGAASELIDDRDGAYPEAAAIVRNVLFLGMPGEACRVISKWDKREEDKT